MFRFNYNKTSYLYSVLTIVETSYLYPDFATVEPFIYVQF